MAKYEIEANNDWKSLEAKAEYIYQVSLDNNKVAFALQALRLLKDIYTSKVGFEAAHEAGEQLELNFNLNY